MSAEGWIYMVGFRVFDIGLLVAWLVWFFRIRDDGTGPPDDEGRDDDGGGPSLDPGDPSGGGGLGLFLPGTLSSERRMRDHCAGGRKRVRQRGGEPLRLPSPVS